MSSSIFWFQSCLKVLRLLHSDGRIGEHGGGGGGEEARRRNSGLRFYSISAFRAVAVDTLVRSSFPSFFLSTAVSSASAAGVQLCSISSSILHSALVGAWMKPPARRAGSDRGSSPPKAAAVKHVLCLSNGHGEDSIAVSVLAQLMVSCLFT